MRRSRNQKGLRIDVGLRRIERLSDETLGISFGPLLLTYRSTVTSLPVKRRPKSLILLIPDT